MAHLYLSTSHSIRVPKTTCIVDRSGFSDICADYPVGPSPNNQDTYRTQDPIYKIPKMGPVAHPNHDHPNHGLCIGSAACCSLRF